MSSTMNIIMFGETGVGKSSVINLIAGKRVAETSPDAPRCTPPNSLYTLPRSIRGRTLHIWETIGLEEPEKIDSKSYRRMIEQVCDLIHQLASKGGVDLLLFCLLSSRVTKAVQRNYKLLYEVLCGSKVPIALVITKLEREADMEGWWNRNARGLEGDGIRVTGHACVTAEQSHSTKYRESQENMVKLLEGHGHSGTKRFHMSLEDWFIEVLPHLLQVGEFSTLKKEAKRKVIIEVLKKKYKIDSKSPWATDLGRKLESDVYS